MVCFAQSFLSEGRLILFTQAERNLAELRGQDVALHCDLIPGNFIQDTSLRLWIVDFE